MRYDAEIDGKMLGIEVAARNGHFDVTVDGRPYEVEVVNSADGAVVLLIGNLVYETRAWSTGNGALRVRVRGREFTAKLTDRRHSKPGSQQHGSEKLLVTAPMPGKVVRILVSPDEEITAGQGIVVVEAMKMQNEMKAARDGKVAEVRVSEGDAVSAAQVLVVIE